MANWYQFKVVIDRLSPEQSKIVFSQDPILSGGKLGGQINDYLIQANFVQSELEEGCEYVYQGDAPHLAYSQLSSLYEKFKEAGAELEYIDISQSFVSREEFESLKKKSAIAQSKLEDLKQQLSSLQND